MPSSTQRSRFAPDPKEQQIAMANQLGSADATELEKLAQYADYQSDIGEWHYGYVTAQRLRLLGAELERQHIGQSERDRLHRTIADLSQQVEELTEDEDVTVELVFTFVSDGPATLSVGDFHLVLSLLVEPEPEVDNPR